METVLLSVVLPVFERARGFAADLPDLARDLALAEKVLGRVEVIFVDNASQDHTVDVIEEHLALFERAKLVRLPWPCGPATAARAGVAASSGEFIALTDLEQCADIDHLTTVLTLLNSADVIVRQSPLPSSGMLPTMTARLGSAAHKLLANRWAANTATSQGHHLEAFRATVAKPLLTLLRSPELTFGAEARVVTASMGLRIAQLPTSKSATARREVTPPRYNEQAGIAALVGDLLRARSHRSRALKASFAGTAIGSVYEARATAEPVESSQPRRAEG